MRAGHPGGRGIEKSIQIISFLLHTHMFAFAVGGWLAWDECVEGLV
jgi:hypothetical protein